MRPLSILVPALTVLSIGSSFGQDNPGWQNSDRSRYTAAAVRTLEWIDAGRPAAERPAPEKGAQSALTVGNDADAITPEIETLARGLLYDPVRIHNFCKNHIEYEHYFGSKKGAALTLLEGKGNSFDISALMVALLRASGFTASYRYGPREVSDEVLADWLGTWYFGDSGVPFPQYTDAEFRAAYGFQTDPRETTTLRYLINQIEFSLARGFPAIVPLDSEGYSWAIPHVSVQFEAEGSTRYADPSIKSLEPAASVPAWESAVPYDRSALLTAVGGSTDANSVTGLNETSLATTLTSYTTSVSQWIRNNAHDRTVAEFFGERRQQNQSITNLGELPTVVYNTAIPWLSVTTWTAIPTTWMAKIRITCGQGYNQTTNSFSTTYYDTTLNMPALAGRKLALTFSGITTTGRFYLDDVELGSASFTSTPFQVRLQADHAHGWYDLSTGVFTDDGSHDQRQVSSYARAESNAYVFLYGFSPGGRLLSQRQALLEEYKRQGLADTSREVRTELLNIIGLNWLIQTDINMRAICGSMNVSPLDHHRFGRMAQESAYYIDVALQFSGNLTPDGDDARATKAFQVRALLDSALEHGVIEQLQGSTNAAVSTIRLLQLCNQQGGRAYRAESSNWSTVRAALLLPANGYTTTVLDNEIAPLINAGATVLIPNSPNIQLGSWHGKAYASISPVETRMIIEGGYNGGYLSAPGTVSYTPFSQDSFYDPEFAHMSTSDLEALYLALVAERVYGADPVDMASGAFTFEKTDLVIGDGQLPRGITFARYYNSNRGVGKLGRGWGHSLDIRVEERSAATSGLGAATPHQMAPYLATLVVVKDLFCNGTTAKDWQTAALAIKWLTEQLRYKTASVFLGNQAVEFVLMPDGTYTPPPGVTLSLTKNGSGNFVLQERNGNTYTFDSSNRIASIADVYGKTATFDYTVSTRVQVKDCFGRTLDIDSSAGKISRVTDRTAGGRDVEFYYTGDRLTSAIDPEQKTWTFAYTAEERMSSIVDPRSRTTVANTYDSRGRVIEQRSEGNASKLWKLYYSGYENIEEDPLGGLKTYHFDERGRSIGTTDALGHRSSRTYDGQDRTVSSTDETGHTTYYTYNADHNLTQISDPRWDQPTQTWVTTGRIASKTYDSLARLETETDYRGNTTTYTYNDKHQVLTVKDAKNVVVATNTYDTNGNLQTVKDAANYTTTFTYGDTWWNVTRVDHPDAKNETFAYNETGNLQSHTDARNLTTAFTYNQRRELLRTTAPGGAWMENTYDECGDLVGETDFNGHTTTHTYSPSGKRLTTTYPATEAGTSVVTLAYDARDWLQSTTDPLGRVVTYGYDAAGRRTSVTDPLNRTTTFAYDAAGRQTSVTNSLGTTTTFALDDRGRPVTTTDALANASSNTFDANGNLVGFQNRRSQSYAFTFDPNNRPLTTVTPLGKTTTRTWNTRGLLETLVEASNQTTSFTYDSRSRIHTQTEPGRVLTYSYAEVGHVTGVTDGTKSISRRFDSRNWVQSYTDSDGNTTDYGYDAVGNVTYIVYPDSKNVNYRYDEQNHLKTVTDWVGRVTRYTYDRAGRLLTTQRPNGTVRTVTYDDGDQVTRIDERAADGTLLLLYLFRYDAAGRMLNEHRAPRLDDVVEPASNASYDIDNRLTAFNGVSVVHDNDGNMTSGPLLGSTAVTYTYDAANRLLSAGGVSYTYDVLGNRTAVTQGGAITRYAIDPHAPLSRVLIRTKSTNAKSWYVHGHGLLYEVDEAGATRTYHADYRGSTALITADDGLTVTDEVQYSAYGLTVSRYGTTDTPFLYNGAFGVMTDPNGLLHMRARFYNPQLMCFVNADPIGFDGGSNWYAYANGNPVGFNDPDGEFAQFLIGAAIGGLMDYGFQVAANLAQGKSLGASLRQVDVGNILISAAAGSIGAGFGTIITRGLGVANMGISTAAKVATRAAINASVNAYANGAAQIARNLRDPSRELLDGVPQAFIWGSMTGAVGSAAGDLVEGVGRALFTPGARLPFSKYLALSGTFMGTNSPEAASYGATALARLAGCVIGNTVSNSPVPSSVAGSGIGPQWDAGIQRTCSRR